MRSLCALVFLHWTPELLQCVQDSCVSCCLQVFPLRETIVSSAYFFSFDLLRCSKSNSVTKGLSAISQQSNSNQCHKKADQLEKNVKRSGLAELNAVQTHEIKVENQGVKQVLLVFISK